MKKYINDFNDLWSGKTCPNDYSLFYSFLLHLPDFIIATLIVVLLSLFFKPTICKAATYYDYEKVEVENLPDASEDTLNKVYITNGKYYVTNYRPGEKRHFEVGDSVCNVDIIFNIPDDFGVSLTNYLSGNTDFAIRLTNSNFGNGGSGLQVNSPFDNNSYTLIYFGSNNLIYQYNNGIKTNLTSIYLTKSSFAYGVECNIISLDNSSGILDYVWIQASGSYSWLEVSKDDVYEYKLPTDNFYMFFNFDDIKGFDVLSTYDLDSLNDFQKIVLLLGFNIFFLGFVGFIVYILIKLINKGISIIFR